MKKEVLLLAIHRRDFFHSGLGFDFEEEELNKRCWSARNVTISTCVSHVCCAVKLQARVCPAFFFSYASAVAP